MKKTTQTTITPRTTRDEAFAMHLVQITNRVNKKDVAVLVDGPDDGEFTVMSLRDAIANEFTYRWAV